MYRDQFSHLIFACSLLLFFWAVVVVAVDIAAVELIVDAVCVCVCVDVPNYSFHFSVLSISSGTFWSRVFKNSALLAVSSRNDNDIGWFKMISFNLM